ncbi:hypothetical protein C7999DRAFT_35778 [Corynascus novoguineensis]|uniref:Carrier domain-containing protein n=1 Tax=Corynascus novoguineensis TaxID=1126955 RepID=A0AAN7HJ26_9PEZI|nr:hypothetical protein C7999DRAFT_35778 [Corynascus novoguineensis]
MDYFRLGVIRSISPNKFLDAVNIEGALRYMEKCQYTGKLVIKSPTDHSVFLFLPASALDISIIEKVGWVSEAPSHLEQLKATAAYCLKEQDLPMRSSYQILKCLRPAHQASIYPTDGYLDRSQIGRGIRMTLPITSDATAASGSTIFAWPDALREPAAVMFLAREIGVTLFGFMMKPFEKLDVRQPHAAVGVDSLVVIELRNWSRQRLEMDMSVPETLRAESIEKLGLWRLSVWQLS